MDYFWEEISDISVSKIVKWGAAGGMIFGGVVPYIPQYKEIRRTEDAEGFSLFVCLALLIANTLRILFWFGRRYELPLLVQSIVMIVTMFMMVRLCVNIKNKNQIIRGRERIFTASGSSQQRQEALPPIAVHTFSDFDSQYFWAWTDFVSYVDFMVFFTLISSLLMYVLIEVNIFVELVGFLAVFIEALLGSPQLVRNYKNKSTAGMSVKMVVMWTVGDTFKTGYFLLREAPVQFWLCGMLQVGIDIAILLQVRWYRHNLGHRVKKQDVPD
ncbi:solute carrier family 66 member 2 isoform X1 [Anabrus simplex]|uniref:solute carrier family 66 member 2 isoform X1 n=1 Tax=Anabrus simplex TaxID=316456 RepID=UPI0035A2C1F5